MSVAGRSLFAGFVRSFRNYLEQNISLSGADQRFSLCFNLGDPTSSFWRLIELQKPDPIEEVPEVPRDRRTSQIR
jgi:hypothetical protein